MSVANTPQIPASHFNGNRNLTEGNVSNAEVGSLASLLENLRLDALASNVNSASFHPKQTVMADDAGGAATANIDIPIPAGVKIRVVDFKVIMRGNGTTSDTAQLKKLVGGTTPQNISDAVDISDGSGAGKTKTQTTLSATYWELDGDNGDELRITLTDGGGTDRPAVTACVDVLPVA